MTLALALCCFNKKTAMYLEKTNLIITTIAIIFNIFKLCVIPWGATSYAMEFIAVILFIFLAINSILVFLFFLLRLKNMVNDYNFKNCLITCYVMIFFSFLSCFFEILQMCVVLSDLYYYTGTYYSNSNEVVVSDAEFFVAFFTIVPSVIFWFIIFMLWISEWLRVSVKTYGNYEDYMNDDIEIVIVKKKGKKNNINNKKEENINNKGKEKNVPVKQSDNKNNNISGVRITYA